MDSLSSSDVSVEILTKKARKGGTPPRKETIPICQETPKSARLDRHLNDGDLDPLGSAPPLSAIGDPTPAQKSPILEELEQGGQSWSMENVAVAHTLAGLVNNEEV